MHRNPVSSPRLIARSVRIWRVAEGIPVMGTPHRPRRTRTCRDFLRPSRARDRDGSPRFCQKRVRRLPRLWAFWPTVFYACAAKTAPMRNWWPSLVKSADMRSKRICKVTGTNWVRSNITRAQTGSGLILQYIKPGKIQARATEFTKFSQRSGRKARRTAVQYPWTLGIRAFILLILRKLPSYPFFS